MKSGIGHSALFLAGALLTALASGELSKSAPANSYVDSHECARCHSDIYETYRKTGMGRSLFRPSLADTIEDYAGKHEYYQALSDTHYSMIMRDGAFFQRRWQLGADGAEINVEELKIDYVVGAGDVARSYLHRTARDTLIELPLGWYSERGGYWAMSPGFDSRHPQTRRLISNECIFCHTAYPQISAASAASGGDAVFKEGSLPEGIDCQRCHGPGARHVSLVRDPNATPGDFAATIVNPAKLDSKRQMDVCMQCHLEPTSTRLPSIIRKFDRGPFSYVPGEPLENFNRYFDFAPDKAHDDRFELVSAAYRLRKSRCFLESNDALTCLTCHNPHRTLPVGEAATQTYAAACRKCHEPAMAGLIASGKHTPLTDCVGCHMPRRRTDDVVHAVITDHLIQRKPPKGDLLAERPEVHPSAAEEYRGEVIPYYPSHPSATPENLLYRGVAQVALENNLERGVADLSRAISLNPPKLADFYVVLGNAWQADGKPREAGAAYKQALQFEPDSAPTLRALANALEKARDTPQSQKILTRALRVAPLDPENWYQYGLLELKLGETRGALEKIQKALALKPDIPEGYFNLANLLVRTGEIDAGSSMLQSALRMDPYDAAAYDLNGQVLARQGKSSEALSQFEKAIRLRPDYAPYLYDDALALVRAGLFDQAKMQAEAAVRLDPNFSEAHEVLGRLFAREKHIEEATREYRTVVELHPDLARAQLNLGLLLASKGDLPGATEHLRRAENGNDPDLARQAALALARIDAK